MAKPDASVWDLTALFNAADPKASLAERPLWVIRLVEWLRRAPIGSGGADATGAARRPPEARTTPQPVLRLRHVLGVLERNPEQEARVARACSTSSCARSTVPRRLPTSPSHRARACGPGSGAVSAPVSCR